MTDRESESHQEQPRAAVVKAEPEFSGDSLALFLAELGRYPLLTAAEEVALAKRIERGDAGAKESLVNSNLRWLCRSRSVTATRVSRSST